MNRRRCLAVALLAIGAALMLAAPWLPGGPHLIVDDPPRQGSVTALSARDRDIVLAATQSGELWRLAPGDDWRLIERDPRERPVMAIASGMEPPLLGTSAGLRHWRGPAAPEAPRVGDLLVAGDELLLATTAGLLTFDGERWASSLSGHNVYRLQRQHSELGTVVHAGTIGAGVKSAPDGRWVDNSEGLPRPANILSFALTDGGLLMAGTDSGLFWQSGPGEIWRQVDAGLGARRILSLYREPATGRTQRLWVGSDDGLHSLNLVERAGSLGTRGTARRHPVRGPEPLTGVAAIVPYADSVVLAAGRVYRLAPVRHHLWHRVLIIGGVLVVAGIWLLRHRRRLLR